MAPAETDEPFSSPKLHTSPPSRAGAVCVPSSTPFPAAQPGQLPPAGVQPGRSCSGPSSIELSR